MKPKSTLPQRTLFLAAAIVYAVLLAASAQAQFLWSERVATTTTLPENELEIGLALDTNDNCYVTGWFDGTNNFGGVTLTNQSTGGGSDIFVAKYNFSGALQWAQRAGSTVGNQNTGNGLGIDANGNVYVTGRTWGSGIFGDINLPASGLEEFYLAKYNSAGAIQWVTNSFGISDDLLGTGLAVDGAGNSYALVNDDDLDYTYVVKYDTSGALQWVQVLSSSGEVWATKVAVDANGYVYVRGTFAQNMTIGNSNLVVSPAGATKNMFVAKFNNAGALVWVQQPTGGNVDEGGVAVDRAGNVYTTGAFTGQMNFGNGVSLTSEAGSGALFGSAFIAEYNSSGVFQWAEQAGGTNGGFYWDVALDGQTNVYPTGFLGSEASVAKYGSSGALQWSYTANNLAANPVGSTAAKCAVDSAGHCYLAGWYQGTATFGANTLQPQGYWNYFLTEVGPSNAVASPTIQFTASPTSGLPPLTVQFNSTNVDSQGNTINSWNWDFGDGGTSTLQNPSYTYTNSGTFNPSFVANNNHGVAVIGYGPQITILTPTSSTNFTYTINNGVITITGYTGSGVAVNIPDAINSLPVTSIGDWAFSASSLTSVTIPDSVTSIGNAAFYECWSLTSVTISSSVTNIGDWAFFDDRILTSVTTLSSNVTSVGMGAFDDTAQIAITVDADNPVYSSVAGVLFNKNQTTLIQYPDGAYGSYTIPDGVTNIEANSFAECGRLTGITIPNSVTSIGEYAFEDCQDLISVTVANSVTSIGDYAFAALFASPSITAIYFQGNAPLADSTVFSGDTGTVYYLPGTSGWGPTFGGLPTALWYQPQPLILISANGNTNFGVKNNQFGFSVSWATNLSVVVEASTNLANPVWTPVVTNALTNGSIYFSDPQWTNYPGRFYRISAP